MGNHRNAFIMSILQLPKTVVMFVMAFSVDYLSGIFKTDTHYLSCLVSLPAYASAMLYNKFFKNWKISFVRTGAGTGSIYRKRMKEYFMMRSMKALR